MDHLTSKQCSIHKQECVGIDVSPYCTIENRYCCFECVKQRNQEGRILSYNKALNFFLDIQKEFKHKKTTQNNHNFKLFKDLGSLIDDIKKNQNLLLDKLYGNIIQQIKIITDMQTQLDEKLGSLSMDQFFSSTNDFAQLEPYYLQIKKILQTSIQRILQEDLINRFSSTLQQIDDQVISLTPDYQFDIYEHQQKSQHLNFICSQHNKEIQLFDLSVGNGNENRMFCIECISEKPVKLIAFSKVQQLLQEYEIKQKNQFENSYQELKQKIEGAQNSLTLLKDQFQVKIEEANYLLATHLINQQQLVQQRHKTMGKDWFMLSKEEVIDITEILSKPKYNEESQSLIEEDYKKNNDAINLIIHDIVKSLKILDIQTFQALESIIEKQIRVIPTDEKGIQTSVLALCHTECQASIKKILGFKNFHCAQIQMFPKYYVLKNEYKIDQVEWCSAMAFNKQQSLLAAGCDRDIKIFSFNIGKLNQLQVLSEERYIFTSFYIYIKALQFIESSNELVSGNNYGSLKVWKQNTDEQWFLKQQVDAHNSCINCMILNEQENLLITCGKTIKFWTNQGELKICKQLNPHSKKDIWSISLNETETQLISCGFDKQVVISEISSNGEWSPFDKIDVQQVQQRACYVGDNSIALQLNDVANMKILKKGLHNRIKYTESQEIKIGAGGKRDYLFQLSFNKSQQMLLNKNGQTINLMKRRTDGQFIVEQTIDLLVRIYLVQCLLMEHF